MEALGEAHRRPYRHNMEEPECGWGQEPMVQGALLGTSRSITTPGSKERLAG